MKLIKMFLYEPDNDQKWLKILKQKHNLGQFLYKFDPNVQLWKINI